MTNKTENLEAKFKFLMDTKNQISTQPPSLDNIVPLYEKVEKTRDELLEALNNTKKAIEEKRKLQG
jgi:hypothetical protein